MQQKSIMEMADNILGGVLTDASKVSNTQAEGGSMAMPTEEVLPELSEGQHDTLMSHVLGEGKVIDTVKKGVAGLGNIGRRIGKAIDNTRPSPELLKKAGHQDRDSYKAGKDVKPLPPRRHFPADKSGTVRNADRYGVKGEPPKPGLVKGGPKPRGSIGDLQRKKRLPGSDSIKGNLKKPKPGIRKEGPKPRNTITATPPLSKRKELIKHNVKMGMLKKENITSEQLDVLQAAKDILGEMTAVGSIGVNMAGGKKSKGGSHHRAMDVKLPGDAAQAAAIKAASTPPVFKAKVAKEAAPVGRKNTRVIVKRKTNQSKDDETQIRVHNDMKAMYHESFDSFVDGILLKEDASKGYPGDVSVAEFGRKGPSSDTFGGGGVRSKGRGPKIQLTKNQLMTAKKKGKGSDKDHETPGFGKASSHSRKHPQNPYAGGK